MPHRALLIALTLLCLLLSSACSAGRRPGGEESTRPTDSTAEVPSRQVPAELLPGTMTGRLPALPGLPGAAQPLPLTDSGAARHSGYDQFEFIEGNAIYTSSPDNVFFSSSVLIYGNAGDFGWAMYSVNTGGYKPKKLDLELATSTNGTVYVGLSKFSSGRWEFHGPYSGSASIDIGSGDYLSGAADSADRRFYFLVVAPQGTLTEHKYSVVHFDNAIPNGTQVSGQLLDEQDRPVAGMSVQLQPLGRYVETDTQGKYTFYDVADGDYDLSPDDVSGRYDSFNPPLRQISVTGSDLSLQDFTATSYEVRGKATLNGAGYPLLTMLLNPGNLTTQCGSDGSFEFRRLAPGNYTLSILTGGIDASPLSYSLEIVAADIDGCDFSLVGVTPAYIIQGSVRSGGLGIAGAAISLQPGNKLAVTDEDGHFVFYSLAPGTYQLSAFASGYKMSPTYQTLSLVDNDLSVDISAEAVQLYEVQREIHEEDLSHNDIGFIPKVDVYFANKLTDEVLAIATTNEVGKAAVMLPPGEYYSYLKHPLFNGVSSFGSRTFTVSNTDLLFVDQYERVNTVTWESFVAAYVSDECIQCHRPDAQTAVDPPLRTYEEVSTAASACNARIANGTMPPGTGSNQTYRRWFKIWRDNSTPLN